MDERKSDGMNGTIKEQGINEQLNFFFSFLKGQTRTLQGSDSKLSGLQSKYTTLEKENKQLTDKVRQHHRDPIYVRLVLF